MKYIVAQLGTIHGGPMHCFPSTLCSIPNLKSGLYTTRRKWIVPLGFFVTTSVSNLLIGAPLDDWFSPPTVGASASCALVDTSVMNSADSQITSCTLPGESMGSADLPNTQVRIYAAASQPGDPSGLSTGATTAFMDLITVTDGWDANGEANGTFELVVQGSMDDSNLKYVGNGNFAIDVWKVPCLAFQCDEGNPDDRYYANRASVNFDLYGGSTGPGEGVIGLRKEQLGTGRVAVQSENPADLRARLAVRWSATRDKPSFYIMAYAQGGMWGATTGKVDFFDSGRTYLFGPDGFKYTSTNGYGSGDAGQPSSAGAVDLGGTVRTAQGSDICAIVLASGESTFSCGPHAAYSLNDLSREADGTVTRQVYADGFFPNMQSVKGSVSEAVVMRPAFGCPKYNPPSNPGVFPGSAGRPHSISGRVLQYDPEVPLCAMVLANGSYLFSCDGTGSYSLEFPLDNNGQYTLQVYADGYAPAIQIFDEFATPGDVLMANSAECQ